MNDFGVARSAPATPDSKAAALFMWRGGGIILIGVHERGRWVLARAWSQGDCLEHVRRWSFAAPIPFSGQVRRLIVDAVSDHSLARDEAFRALVWAEALA